MKRTDANSTLNSLGRGSRLGVSVEWATGLLQIGGGTEVLLNRSTTDSSGFAATVQLLGGNLMLGNDEQMSDDRFLRFNVADADAGTFELNGHTETFAGLLFDGTTASTSIDMGDGGVLNLANQNANAAWEALTVLNWDSGVDHIYVTGGGFSSNQLADIAFVGFDAGAVVMNGELFPSAFEAGIGPTINTFSVEHSVMIKGDKTRLSWSLENASTISITPAVGEQLDLLGNVMLSPEEDTLYTLTAAGFGGSVTQTIFVGVVEVAFSATPNVITNAGDSVSLSWNVSGADSVSVEPGIGAVAFGGNRIVMPASNTVYTLTASRSEGSTFKKVFIYFHDQVPPNILFIAVDDLKRIGGYFSDDPGNFLQCVYPDPLVRSQVLGNLTPNIDQLASEGVSFMRAYCASPACNPSRAALMTGIRPHRTGLTDNKDGVFFRDWGFGGEQPLANAVTLSRHLRNNGYYVAGIGKIFHAWVFDGADGNETRTDWGELSASAGTRVNSVYAEGLPSEWRQEGPDNASYTQMVGYQRADFIARMMEDGTNGSFILPDNKPFFLACGIIKPHLPYYVTKDLADLFPVSQMTGVTCALHDEFFNDCDDLPPSGLLESGGDKVDGDLAFRDSDYFVRILQKGLIVDPVDGDLNGWKDMLQYYFACTALADRSVARLLEGLANSPYADNTIVIFWSDHGYHLGEKMHLTKFTLWEDGAGVHFIIRDPKYSGSAGDQCQRPVNLIDIYPTVCERLGLPLPDPRITGHDLSPLLADPRSPWNIPSLCADEATNGNMIAMARFKFICYNGDSNDAELYDHDAGPAESTNLMGNPAYAVEQAEMLELLDIALAEGTFPAERQWSLESWRHSYWNISGNIGDAADSANPDGDDWVSFQEFALLGNPLEASPELANAFSFVIEGDEAAYRFPYRDAPGSVGYKVGQTTNLIVGWSNLWNSATDSVDDVTEVDHGNGTRNLRVGVPIDQSTKFLQLTIVQQ